MQYKNSNLISIKAENGIIFITLEHLKSKIKFETFLSSAVLKNPQYLNEEEIIKEFEKYEEEARKKKKVFLKQTILLEIQMDLIRIYKEYIG